MEESGLQGVAGAGEEDPHLSPNSFLKRLLRQSRLRKDAVKGPGEQDKHTCFTPHRLLLATVVLLALITVVLLLLWNYTCIMVWHMCHELEVYEAPVLGQAEEGSS